MSDTHIDTRYQLTVADQCDVWCLMAVRKCVSQRRKTEYESGGNLSRLCVIKWTFIDFDVNRNAFWFIHIAVFLWDCLSLLLSVSLLFFLCWTGATLTSDNSALSLSFICTVGCLLLLCAIWKKGIGRGQEKKRGKCYLAHPPCWFGVIQERVRACW